MRPQAHVADPSRRRASAQFLRMTVVVYEGCGKASKKDSPMSITVYGFLRSIASFRVRVALKLKGLPFEEIPVDILSGEQFKPDYAAVSAERVVPTFIHDGHSIFQSLAIIDYLDALQPTPRLIPKDVRERAWALSLS